MMEPEFKVGQLVCLRAPERDPAAGQAVSYKVLRLLPRRGNDRSYGVKTILEPEERLVGHSELALLSGIVSARITLLPERIKP